MAGNLGVLGFLSMVGLAITLSRVALMGVTLAAQVMDCVLVFELLLQAGFFFGIFVLL